MQERRKTKKKTTISAEEQIKRQDEIFKQADEHFFSFLAKQKRANVFFMNVNEE